MCADMTSVASADKTSAVSAAKTCVASTATTSVLSMDKTSHISMESTTPARVRCAGVVDGIQMCDVLSVDTTDVSRKDKTEALPADTSDVMSANKLRHPRSGMFLEIFLRTWATKKTR